MEVMHSILIYTMRFVLSLVILTTIDIHFLMEVLVSSFCKGWKSLVDNVLLTIQIILTSTLELIHEFIWDSGQPSLILVPVLSVSVTIMHDVVVNCRFYIKNNQVSVSSFLLYLPFG